MMGSVEMMHRMLGKFIAAAPEACDLLESTVRLGEAEAIASCAHRQKGAAQTMAAPRVAACAAELERQAATASTAELLALVADFRDAHRELQAAYAAEGEAAFAPGNRTSV
jgi:HPt (histidine-containing phosphotransfer) domain-containing protein